MQDREGKDAGWSQQSGNGREVRVEVIDVGEAVVAHDDVEYFAREALWRGRVGEVVDDAERLGKLRAAGAVDKGVRDVDAHQLGTPSCHFASESAAAARDVDDLAVVEVADEVEQRGGRRIVDAIGEHRFVLVGDVVVACRPGVHAPDRTTSIAAVIRVHHPASRLVYDRCGVRSYTVVGMTPEEIADLVHLRRARDLMDRDYAQPLDVPAMARAALMSPAHFSRKFRAAYGETPYSYLMTRRIERAKALLRQGNSVTDTCFAVGCTSLGSFSSRFTEIVGETPSQYRARDHRDVEVVPSCVSMYVTRPRRTPVTA